MKDHQAGGRSCSETAIISISIASAAAHSPTAVRVVVRILSIISNEDGKQFENRTVLVAIEMEQSVQNVKLFLAADADCSGYGRLPMTKCESETKSQKAVK